MLETNSSQGLSVTENEQQQQQLVSVPKQQLEHAAATDAESAVPAGVEPAKHPEPARSDGPKQIVQQKNSGPWKFDYEMANRTKRGS